MPEKTGGRETTQIPSRDRKRIPKNKKRHVVNLFARGKEVSYGLELNARVLIGIAKEHKDDPDSLTREEAGNFLLSLLRLSASMEEALTHIVAKNYGFDRDSVLEWNSSELISVYADREDLDPTPLFHLQRMRNTLSHAVRPLPLIRNFLNDAAAIPGFYPTRNGKEAELYKTSLDVLVPIKHVCAKIKEDFDKTFRGGGGGGGEGGAPAKALGPDDLPGTGKVKTSNHEPDRKSGKESGRRPGRGPGFGR